MNHRTGTLGWIGFLLLSMWTNFGVAATWPAPTRPGPETIAPTRTYVILVGYPDGSDNVAPLPVVGADVYLTLQAFRMLSPDREFVLLDAERFREDRVDEHLSVRDATWTLRRPSFEALKKTVADVEQDIANARAKHGNVLRTRVYFYYTGHGEAVQASKAAETYTRLFFEDGPVDAPTFNRDVVARLSAIADQVHLVFDACQTAFMVQTQAYRKGVLQGDESRAPRVLPPVPKHLMREFASRFPNVGVLFASAGFQPGVAYENIGSPFSLGLRSAIVGHADPEGRGLITYARAHSVINSALRHLAPPPSVLAPRVVTRPDPASVAGDAGTKSPGDAVFVDLHPFAGAVRLRFAGEAVDRHEIYIDSFQSKPFAVVFPESEVDFYFARNLAYDACRRKNPFVPCDWRAFDGADPDLKPVLGRLEKGKKLPKFMITPPRLDGQYLEPINDSSQRALRPYVGFGVQYDRREHPYHPPAELASMHGISFSVRYGLGRHQWGLEASYAESTVFREHDDFGYDAKRFGFTLGWTYLVLYRDFDVGLGPFVGGAWLGQQLESGAEKGGTALAAAGLRASGFFPLVKGINLRLSVESGAECYLAESCAADELAGVGRLAVGVDYEIVL